MLKKTSLPSVGTATGAYMKMRLLVYEVHSLLTDLIIPEIERQGAGRTSGLKIRQRDTYSICQGVCPEKLALREIGRIEFPPQATACDLHLAINIEVIQIHLPGRVAEMTDPLLALILAMTLGLLNRSESVRRNLLSKEVRTCDVELP